MFSISNLPGLGTHWWFEIFDSVEDPAAVEKFIKIEIERFEAAYSRFKPSSQISTLNQNRYLSNPSQELLSMLKLAQHFNQVTEGLFHYGLGHVLENRGYDAEYSFRHRGMEEQVIPIEELVKISLENIQLIAVGNLDLGGFGKGYLIDRLADLLGQQFGFTNMIINGGGDIWVNHLEPMQFVLEDPLQSGYELGRIQLNQQALASSSTVKRAWPDITTGQTSSHIIHPELRGNLGQVGSFVTAVDTTTADIIATVACLLVNDIQRLERIRRHISFEYLVMTATGITHRSDGFLDVEN